MTKRMQPRFGVSRCGAAPKSNFPNRSHNPIHTNRVQKSRRAKQIRAKGKFETLSGKPGQDVKVRRRYEHPVRKSRIQMKNEFHFRHRIQMIKPTEQSRERTAAGKQRTSQAAAESIQPINPSIQRSNDDPPRDSTTSRLLNDQVG